MISKVFLTEAYKTFWVFFIIVQFTGDENSEKLKNY